MGICLKDYPTNNRVYLEFESVLLKFCFSKVNAICCSICMDSGTCFETWNLLYYGVIGILNFCKFDEPLIWLLKPLYVVLVNSENENFL